MFARDSRVTRDRLRLGVAELHWKLNHPSQVRRRSGEPASESAEAQASWPGPSRRCTVVVRFRVAPPGAAATVPRDSEPVCRPAGRTAAAEPEARRAQAWSDSVRVVTVSLSRRAGVVTVTES